MESSKILIGLALFALLSFLNANAQKTSYDDIYYSPKDAVKKEPKPSMQSAPQEGSAIDASEKYTDENGNNYISYNYYNDDYSYSSRIRRFHSPLLGFGYYDSYYANPYWCGYAPFWWRYGFGYYPWTYIYYSPGFYGVYPYYTSPYYSSYYAGFYTGYFYVEGYATGKNSNRYSMHRRSTEGNTINSGERKSITNAHVIQPRPENGRTVINNPVPERRVNHVNPVNENPHRPRFGSEPTFTPKNNSSNSRPAYTPPANHSGIFTKVQVQWMFGSQPVN